MDDECTPERCALFVEPCLSCPPQDNKERLEVAGETDNNQSAKLSDDIDMATPGEPKSPNNHAVTAHFKECAKNNDLLAANTLRLGKVETLIAAITERLEHANPQLNNLEQQMACVLNKLQQDEGESQRECRKQIRFELRSPDSPFKQVIQASVRAEVQGINLDNRNVMAGLQSQMDNLRLTVKHLPKAKADDRRGVRRRAAPLLPRQTAPSQESATAAPIRPSNNERITVLEGNVDKLQETISSLTDAVKSLTDVVKSLQKQVKPE